MVKRMRGVLISVLSAMCVVSGYRAVAQKPEGTAVPKVQKDYSRWYEECLIMLAETGQGRKMKNRVVPYCTSAAIQMSQQLPLVMTMEHTLFENCLVDWAREGSPPGLNLDDFCLREVGNQKQEYDGPRPPRTTGDGK